MAACQPIEPFAFNGEVDCSRPRSGPPPSRRGRRQQCREVPVATSPGTLACSRSEARVEISKRYLAPQHIDQLRQGVDAGVPEKRTDPRRLLSPSWGYMFRIMHSGPEFQLLETAPAAADTLLPFQN